MCVLIAFIPETLLNHSLGPQCTFRSLEVSLKSARKRKEKGGRRKEEGGRRKEEGGRRKE